MAEDNQLSFSLDLDSSDFTDAAKGALDSIKKLGDTENLSGLLEGFESLGIALGVAGAAVLAFKVGLDLTEEGDQVKRIDDQFALLTRQAGISTETLKTGLEKAAGGMVATTDLLKIANGAIVTMGSSASNLPEVLTLARQATTLFGGDVKTNFQGMVEAIETGNTRMLKHMGIVVDTNAAYQKFAEQNGIAVNALSEQAKAQAVLNAVLEKGNEQFKGVNVDIGDTTDAVQAMKAAWTEFKETISVIFSDVLGPGFKAFFHTLSSNLKAFNNDMKATFGSGAEKHTAMLDNLNASIAETQKKLHDLSTGKLGIDAATASIQTQLLTARLKNYQEQLTQLQSTQKQGQAENDQATQKQLANIQAVQKANLTDTTLAAANQKKVDEQILKIKAQSAQDQIKLAQQVQKAQEGALKAEATSVQSVADVERSLANQKSEREKNEATALNKINEQFIARAAQREAALKNIENSTAMDHRQKAAEMQAVNAQYANDAINKAKLISLQKQTYAAQEVQFAKQDLKTEEALLKNYQQSSTTMLQGVARQWQLLGVQATHDMMNMAKQGEYMANTIEKFSTNAFEGIGKAMIATSNKGQAAAQAMESAFLSMIGQVAEQYGSMIVAKGIADTVSLNPIGPAEVVAGGALIALGAALGAMGSAASSVSAGSTASPSAGAGPSAPGASSTSQADSSAMAAQSTPQRTVSVNIQGNYLNSAASQRSLMQIIRNENDATGFNVNPIGVR